MEIHLGWWAWPTQILARINKNIPLCPIRIQPKVQVHISNRLAIIEHLVFRLTHLLPNLAIIYNLIKYASLLLLIAKDNYLVFEINRPYIWRIYHSKRYIQPHFETARNINDPIILIINFFPVFQGVLLL